MLEKGNNQLRVLFVSHYDQLLGANRSLLQLILELRELGVRPTVLFSSRNDSSPFQSALDENSIEWIRVEFKMFKQTRLLKIIPFFLLSRCINASVAGKFSKGDFDIVHTNSSTIDVGKCIASRIGAKHVWHLREFGDLDYSLKTPFGKWFQKVIYAGGSDFIAISKKIAEHFSKYTGQDKMHVIYNGIKIPKLVRTERNDGITNFCIVGVLKPAKGQIDLLRAADVLVNNRGVRDFHVYVVGASPDNHIEELRAFCHEKGLEAYVSLLGQRDDVPNILGNMDVGVMASHFEAFGRVTVEYMMSGLAVIASDSGANKEIITSDSVGLVYPSRNIDRLADLMELLIRDPGKRMEIATRARQYAIDNFSSEANSRAVFNLYQKIFNQ